MTFFYSCDFFYKDNGTFGRSNTKDEARKNGSEVFLYLPNKNEFQLLDGTTLTTDTAWTEVSFTYNKGQRVLDSSFGFIFSIPFKQFDPTKFTFNFTLFDTSNRVFTNGIGDDLCQLYPKKLKDEIKVILEQKDTDTSKGWTNPIVTDTITFKRLAK